MTKDEQIKYLKNLLKLANHKIVNLTKPYNLTIDEFEQEIRSLEELKEILQDYKEPVKIQLESKSFGKKR